MKYLSDLLSLLIASTIFLGLFLNHYFLEILSINIIFKDIVIFLLIYFILRLLLSYIEIIFENCRKIL
jgi:hypothetical protein